MTAAESFVRGFHDAEPGATPRSLGWGRLATGESSYEYLAAVIPNATEHARVLDLACGDGHLVTVLRPRVHVLEYTGVDISEGELDRARREFPELSLSFRRERVQQLTGSPASVDYALSHMAMMLFDDLDRVVREVARVLTPGGVFAAVIGGEAADDDDAFAIFARLYREARERGEVHELQLGDPRAHSEQGIRAILSRAAGFEAPVDIHDTWLFLDDDLDRVWSSLALTYDLAYLPDAARRAFEQRFRREAAALANGDGTIPFRLSIRRVSAHRAAD